MVEHLMNARPNEGCGLLAGDGGAVSKVLRMSNAAASPVRYALDPDEQFAAYKLIEEEGLALAGVFHSHTRTEAYPSPTDIRLASETVPYVIVSLATDPATIRAFDIQKDNWMDTDGRVVEVELVVEG
jgi:proteasome lid subunit RPN8/RPN11